MLLPSTKLDSLGIRLGQVIFDSMLSGQPFPGSLVWNGQRGLLRWPFQKKSTRPKARSAISRRHQDSPLARADVGMIGSAGFPGVTVFGPWIQFLENVLGVIAFEHHFLQHALIRRIQAVDRLVFVCLAL